MEDTPLGGVCTPLLLKNCVEEASGKGANLISDEISNACIDMIAKEEALVAAKQESVDEMTAQKVALKKISEVRVITIFSVWRDSYVYTLRNEHLHLRL